jgi:hypothetical protein
MKLEANIGRKAISSPGANPIESFMDLASNTLRGNKILKVS